MKYKDWPIWNGPTFEVPKIALSNSPPGLNLLQIYEIFQFHRALSLGKHYQLANFQKRRPSPLKFVSYFCHIVDLINNYDSENKNTAFIFKLL